MLNRIDPVSMNRQQDLGTKITVAQNFSPDVTEPSTILCPALYLYMYSQSSACLSLSVGLCFLMLMRLLCDARLDLLDGGSGARARFPLDQVRLLAADCLQRANILSRMIRRVDYVTVILQRKSRENVCNLRRSA